MHIVCYNFVGLTERICIVDDTATERIAAAVPNYNRDTDRSSEVQIREGWEEVASFASDDEEKNGEQKSAIIIEVNDPEKNSDIDPEWGASKEAVRISKQISQEITSAYGKMYEQTRGYGDLLAKKKEGTLTESTSLAFLRRCQCRERL